MSVSVDSKYDAVADLDFRRDVDPNGIYELTSLLGEGSYGAVYKAMLRSEGDDSEVAVKIIPDADDDLNSLWREIRFLQVLRSPFVVSFIESLLFDNELWLVMELCDGGSLYDLKEANKCNFKEDQLQAIMAFSVLGLAHLHSQMSIHRDVKSGNILLSRKGVAKLGDFGISAQLTDTIMKRRTVIGSPYWMAPEVIQETSYDSKADVWSLGITLLELCDGHPPHFNVHPMRAIFIISSRAAPTLKDPTLWSPELVDFLSKCLAKNCEQRATSAELLKHPFIRSMVKEIGPAGRPLPLLRDLINRHWESIERVRMSRVKVPDQAQEDAHTPRSGSHGQMAPAGNEVLDQNDISTLRRNSFRGIPAATRQQLRNASLRYDTLSRARSLSGGAGDMSTLVTNPRQGTGDFDSKPQILMSSTVGPGIGNAGLRADSKPTRDPRRNEGKWDAVSQQQMDNEGTLRVSSIRPQNRYSDMDDDMDREGTLNRNRLKQRSGSGSDEYYGDLDYNENATMRSSSLIYTPNPLEASSTLVRTKEKPVSAALKYFQQEPLPEPAPSGADAKGVSERVKRRPPAALRVEQQKESGSGREEEGSALNMLTLEEDVGNEQRIIIKKELLRQLASLKNQYRSDLEQLTRAYEGRRQVLKDALLLFSHDQALQSPHRQTNSGNQLHTGLSGKFREEAILAAASMDEDRK